ncbi:helix-turn-helix domain-containing protein [Rhodococcus globerulus]|uniref:helix-turn-helix domain-containing protein n=1 Tax=Rhodococcus globerulus TaxID=33008 RepID=UPI0030183B72
MNWCAGASRAIVSHRQIAYVPFVSIIAYVSVIGFWCVGASAISAGEQPSVIEQEQARQALQVLRGVEPDVGQTLDVTVAGTAESVHLPRAAFELIRDVLANMAAGQGVTVVPAHAELTTQQAAQMLNVSRPHIIKLLDEGRIEFRLVGRHRRILTSSLIAYQRSQLGSARNAADELAALTEDLGLY